MLDRKSKTLDKYESERDGISKVISWLVASYFLSRLDLVGIYLTSYTHPRKGQMLLS